tara:strand:- start:3939 stop:4571 length:633 start_codon:yes stop_codon:yes gene_type:complete
MDNFDLKKYLVENKVTTNSRMLNEKVATFTLTYNTDQGDLDHVEGLLRKAGIDVVRVEAGTFDDEVEITINKDHLKKAKQALKADGFDISEGKDSTASSEMNEEEDLFTYSNTGQGSGSDSRTQKGTPISVDDVEPEMNVIISYDYNGGQGSGSSGTETLSGKVKSVTSSQIFLIPSADRLARYKSSYQAMYKKEGKGISKRDITKVTVG